VSRDIKDFFDKLKKDSLILEEFTELMDDKDSVLKFFKWIKEQKTKEKMNLIEILKDYKDQKIVRHLETWLQNEEEGQIIARLISLIGKFSFDNKTQILRPFLESEDRRIRANVIEALRSDVLDDNVSDLLLPYLNDTDNRVRANAAMALWKNQGLRDEVKKAFATMIDNNDKWMNASAIYAFGELGIEDFMLYLLEHLMDEDEDICRNALVALIGYADKSIDKEK